MNSMDSAAQFLGLPTGLKKKAPIRRGGGRNKAKPPVATPQQHFQTLQGHMQSGNKVAAKGAALNLVKALHKQTGSVKTVPPATKSPGTPPTPMADPSMEGY